MKEQKNDDKKGNQVPRYNIRFQNECIQVG